MSLLPLGYISQGGGAGASGAFELISTVNASGSSGIITFSSIPATYTHLQIRATGRVSYAAANMTAGVTFNSDTGSNYSFHKLYANGASSVSSSGATQSSINIYNFPANTGATSAYSASVLDILDYANTNKYKTVRMFTGFAANSPYEIGLTSGSWRSTSAITSITITTALGTFLSASRFSLYGIRGA